MYQWMDFHFPWKTHRYSSQFLISEKMLSTFCIEMNCLFAYVRPKMDIRFSRGAKSSFQKHYENAPLHFQANDTRYWFLRETAEPSLNSQEWSSLLLERTVNNLNVRNMVPGLYSSIKPLPNIMREIYDVFSVLVELLLIVTWKEELYMWQKKQLN